MNHLDLFSGIGGFSLAASWVWGKEHNIVSFVEIDPFCQKVLKKHWPETPIISDIRNVTYERIMEYTNSNGFSEYTGRKKEKSKWGSKTTIMSASSQKGVGKKQTNPNPTINLLTGGFPCQPFSCAGKQGGERDDRYLWPEMLRVIQEIRPTWIIGENVAGIINLALDQVLTDLENEGYTCQPFIIPACGKDAPHRRDRVWIVANSQVGRLEGGGNLKQGHRQGKGKIKPVGRCNERGTQDVADTDRKGLQIWQGKTTKTVQRTDSTCGTERKEWLPESNVGRVAHGIPNRVDRLKSLGNAIVPQVVVPIMQAIKA